MHFRQGTKDSTSVWFSFSGATLIFVLCRPMMATLEGNVLPPECGRSQGWRSLPCVIMGKSAQSANSLHRFGVMELTTTMMRARSLLRASLCEPATSHQSLFVVEKKKELVDGYGKQAYELLLGYILDPEYGDITDSKEGTDITLTYTKPNKPGAYPQTSLKMRRNTSTLLRMQKRSPPSFACLTLTVYSNVLVPSKSVQSWMSNFPVTHQRKVFV